MTWSYWNSGCASLGVAPEKRCNPKEMQVWVRDGLVKFPRFTWFLDIFGEVYLENCSLKQITDGLVAFWVIKKKPCETECFTGNSWLWEKIVNLLVSPPFLGGVGCVRKLFASNVVLIGSESTIMTQPSEVGFLPTFWKSTTGVKSSCFWNPALSTTDSDEDDRILLFYIVDSKDFGWSSADPEKNDANFEVLRKSWVFSELQVFRGDAAAIRCNMRIFRMVLHMFLFFLKMQSWMSWLGQQILLGQ